MISGCLSYFIGGRSFFFDKKKELRCIYFSLKYNPINPVHSSFIAIIIKTCICELKAAVTIQAILLAGLVSYPVYLGFVMVIVSPLTVMIYELINFAT